MKPIYIYMGVIGIIGIIGGVTIVVTNHCCKTGNLHAADMKDVAGTVWTPIAGAGIGDGAEEAIRDCLKPHQIECNWEGSVFYTIYVPQSDFRNAISIIRAQREKLKDFYFIEIRDDEEGERRGGSGTRWSTIAFNGKTRK